MTKYRKHREVYSGDHSRWSVYPRIPKPKEFKSNFTLSKGDVVEVEIAGIDEDGCGVARYGRYKVKICGHLAVGDRVRVRITSVLGSEARGEVFR
uniref:TRAM domain-containing protein n=1 Tax=Fervidicoccus fontis TaxID=683846 RepID=A0A7J3ZLT4_9CREN